MKKKTKKASGIKITENIGRQAEQQRSIAFETDPLEPPVMTSTPQRSTARLQIQREEEHGDRTFGPQGSSTLTGKAAVTRRVAVRDGNHLLLIGG